MQRDAPFVTRMVTHGNVEQTCQHWPMSNCTIRSITSCLWSALPASELAGGTRTDSESTATDRVRRVRWSISIITYRNSWKRSRRVGANCSRCCHVDDAWRRRIVRRRQLRIRHGATHDCAFDTAKRVHLTASTARLLDNSLSQSSDRNRSTTISLASLFHVNMCKLN